MPNAFIQGKEDESSSPTSARRTTIVFQARCSLLTGSAATNCSAANRQVYVSTRGNVLLFILFRLRCILAGCGESERLPVQSQVHLLYRLEAV